MPRKELYFSVDIESDGPIPGSNSMLSLGAAAFVDGNEIPVATFYVTIDPLPGASQDPKTMEFWKKHPEAWKQARKNATIPEVAMKSFIDFVRQTSGPRHQPIFVAYPAGFDFTFVYWYLIQFARTSPFSFSALDMKSYAMALLKKPYRESTKKNFPERWFSKKWEHNHHALDDAIGQGIMFLRMKQEAEEGSPRKVRISPGGADIFKGNRVEFE